MTRFKITIEYDGTGLAGWQRQENGPRSKPPSKRRRPGGRPAGRSDGAGRTDAGVHASGQAAHLDIEKELGPDAVRDGLNFWLREGGTHAIVVLAAEIASSEFHARFSAIQRRYRYRILSRRLRRRSIASGSGGCRSPSTPSG